MCAQSANAECCETTLTAVLSEQTHEGEQFGNWLSCGVFTV